MGGSRSCEVFAKLRCDLAAITEQQREEKCACFALPCMGLKPSAGLLTDRIQRGHPYRCVGRCEANKSVVLGGCAIADPVGSENVPRVGLSAVCIAPWLAEF